MKPMMAILMVEKARSALTAEMALFRMVGSILTFKISLT
jgi:hypothetical protein